MPDRSYANHITTLYGGRPLAGLHGLMADGRYVHVRPADDVCGMEDLRAIAGICRDAGGSGVDVLAWDVAPDVDQKSIRKVGRDAKVDIRVRRIPREVMDRDAKVGDVAFYGLPTIGVAVIVTGDAATLTFGGYAPPEGVRADAEAAITHWNQWIDYWAVDWDWREGQPFDNQWQSFRRKKQPDLVWSATHTYDAPGRYSVGVQVINILGDETMTRVAVEIGAENKKGNGR